MLSDAELARYERQLMLPQLDIAGQLALKNAQVMIVGLGGLGSTVAVLLARAGVGHLILLDDDTVEPGNLPRQIAHDSSDCGRYKVSSAKAAIARANPAVMVTVYPRRFSGKLPDHNVSVVVDATDNALSRYALNSACIEQQVPLVFAAVVAMEGQLAVFDPHRGSACYRCLYPELEDDRADCASSGVLGPVVLTLGSLQALEVMKLISGCAEPLLGRLLAVDLMHAQFHTLAVRRRSSCPDCGKLLRS